MLDALKQDIEVGYEALIQHEEPKPPAPRLRVAVHAIIEALDAGKLRVAHKQEGAWEINAWVRKAVLLYFALERSNLLEPGERPYFDKIPSKYSHYDVERFTASGVRIVPPAHVRKGAYVGEGSVIMPSFINIGAYVGAGTLIDTWATVGSCAQIGKNVHLSGGAGIGGVLEPIQAAPVIIEDDCFIGARSEVVEGVLVETGSVLSMGVFLGQSTKIYDREKGSISYGRIPPYSVVIPGSLPDRTGTCHTYCAVIAKRVDAKNAC